jgi:hypothetical protein
MPSILKPPKLSSPDPKSSKPPKVPTHGPGGQAPTDANLQEDQRPGVKGSAAAPLGIQTNPPPRKPR